MDQDKQTLQPSDDDNDDIWESENSPDIFDVDPDLLPPASAPEAFWEDEADDWADIPDIDPDLLTPDIAEILEEENEWAADIPDMEPDLLGPDIDDVSTASLSGSIEAEEETEIPPPEPAIFVTVSPDKMIAFLTIEQDPPVPYQTTVEDIQIALANAKIEFGVLHDKIETIVAEKQYPHHEVIAEGRPMVPGVDGRLEYLFSFSEGGRPKDLGYRVDHYDLNLVRNVNAGDVLVRKIPPQPGQEGMTVQGRLIRPPKLRDPRLPVGKGTKISDDNPLELIAETDGFVRLDRRVFDQVIVDQVFEVYGNVDMSVGNLDVEGAINIRRNVNEGFSVKATGDITIHGLVESCYIEAGGSVEIKGGVIGGLQKATIKADGNIAVKFADQATLIAGQNIFIADEAVNCTLQAEERVVVGDNKRLKGAIIGGRTSAGLEIKAVSAGSDTGIHTRLRVGERPSIVRRRRAMEAEILQNERKLSQLNTHIKAMTDKLAARAAQREARAAQMATLQARRSELYQRLKTLMELAREAGLLTEPDETIDLVRSEVETTGAALERVEAHINVLEQKQAESAEPLSAEDQNTLDKLRVARQNLTNKLNELQTLLTQYKNRWSKEVRDLWRDLQLAKTDLEFIQAKIQQLEDDDALNRKIEQALPQLEAERENTIYLLAQMKEELEILQAEIAAMQKKPPKIVITDKLWPGTEVIIFSHKRRFSKMERSVSVQLVGGDGEEEYIQVRTL